MASDDDVARLRHWITTAMAFAAIACVLAFVPIEYDDMHDYQRHEGYAGPYLVPFVVIAALPAGWVYRRPRGRGLRLWCAWSAIWAIAGGYLFLDDTLHRQTAEPVWVQPVMALLLLFSAAIVVIGLPLLRHLGTDPANVELPAARIVNDDE